MWDLMKYQIYAIEENMFNYSTTISENNIFKYLFCDSQNHQKIENNS